MRTEQEREREREKEIEWDKKSMQLVAPGHRENVRLHEGAGGGWRVSTEKEIRMHARMPRKATHCWYRGIEPFLKA